MDVPPEIAFRGMEPSDILKEAVLDGIDKLEQIQDSIVSCRVVIENATPSRNSGVVYRVLVDLRIPDNSIVVDREPPTDERARDPVRAVGEAFEVARRQLREHKERQRSQGQSGHDAPYARVVRLLTDHSGARYGFLLSSGGTQVYFHEDALDGVGWDELEVGNRVHFIPDGSGEGARAARVTTV
jgi:ribosome-associated translation inhibitor RaiA/cold shock CspA family protein